MRINAARPLVRNNPAVSDRGPAPIDEEGSVK